jgi:F-type H+-transporting ATPase subunit b
MLDLSLLAAAAEHAAHAAHGVEPAEPVAFGFIGAGAWVAASMAVLILIMLWKRVPSIITNGLDKSIAEIRHQLDEAKQLRAEAEALRQEYADKISGAERDAAAMLEHAKHEAEAIVAKAETDTTNVIARRERMAEDKIAAAERTAISDIRARTATVATAAARRLIRDGHTADADRTLVNQAIGAI